MFCCASHKAASQLIFDIYVMLQIACDKHRKELLKAF